MVRGSPRRHRFRPVDEHAGREQRRLRVYHPDGRHLHHDRMRGIDGAPPAPHERQDSGMLWGCSVRGAVDDLTFFLDATLCFGFGLMFDSDVAVARLLDIECAYIGSIGNSCSCEDGWVFNLPDLFDDTFVLRLK